MRANYPKGVGGAQNMSGMLKQAQKMQEDMAALQAELETREYEAVAGGGMVTVKINGKREILNIEIKPEIVDPEDIETLSDVITAAVNEAIKKVDTASENEMAKITGQFVYARNVLSAGVHKMEYLAPLEKLIEQFRKLPGIGRKSAARMTFAVLDLSDEEVKAFSDAILEAKRQVRRCRICHNFSVEEICPICADSTRDRTIICVVEDAKAVLAFEKVRGFRGVYHVLGGVISPINGITPDKLAINDLIVRAKDASEVIVATNPTVEGETTAMYISKLIKPLGVRVSRLAYGIPVGGDIEYADEVTLDRAIEGRKEF